MQFRRLTAAVAITFMVVATAACSGQGESDVDKGTQTTLAPLSEMSVPADPRNLTGTNTAVLENRAIDPVQSDAKPALPVTVTSHDRAKESPVTVTDTSRVVAFDMAGSIASTMWGLGQGKRLVGRDISTDFPGSKKIPIVTKEGHSIDIEKVIELRPTLVLTDGTIGPLDVVEQLRDVGIPVVFVKNDPSFAGASELAHQVAGALGVPEAGELLAQRIASEIDGVKTEIARFVPKDEAKRLRMVFLYIRGNSGVYYLFGDESGADDLIAALGGIDVAKDMGWKGMKPMTDEAIVDARPDLILTMTHGLDSTDGVAGLLEAKPALALTPAGKHSRIIDMADGDILTFGPRSARVLDALARAVYSPGSTP